MRAASGALVLALASGVELSAADLFTITLSDGTIHRWTSYDPDVLYGTDIYSSKKPWLEFNGWNMTNTMEVPNCKIILRSLNDGFGGGSSIKAQIHNGLFDGATVLYQTAFMPVPGDTATFAPAVTILSGEVADINLDGITAEITVKALVSKLTVSCPRNLYQAGCIHTFCDVNCTLLRASFTTSYAVGTSPTRTFIPWSGSPPATLSRYVLGTMTITSGTATAQARTIQAADSSGLTLAYPLYNTPTAGDSFTAFEGCDKTNARCAALANTQHYRGFRFIPPPENAY